MVIFLLELMDQTKYENNIFPQHTLPTWSLLLWVEDSLWFTTVHHCRIISGSINEQSNTLYFNSQHCLCKPALEPRDVICCINSLSAGGLRVTRCSFSFFFCVCTFNGIRIWWIHPLVIKQMSSFGTPAISEFWHTSDKPCSAGFRGFDFLFPV